MLTIQRKENNYDIFGERFRRDDEEDIWEELKYWLENPVSETEKAERDNEINNYIDAVLKKAFRD